MKLLLIAFALFLQITVYACGGLNQPVYSGKIEYSLDSVNPFTCTAIITLDFNIDEPLPNDSIWVDWGDYTGNIIRGLSITEDTAASIASVAYGGTPIYTHVYKGTHTYAGLPVSFGCYYISFQNEFRINGVDNIADGGGINTPIYLTAQVVIDTSANGRYGPMYFAPLKVGVAGANSFEQAGLQQVDTNGDSIVYALSVPLEANGNPVPEYQYPDQYCLANGSSSNKFSIDPVKGDVTWFGPCQQGIFGYGTTLSRYRHGKLLSSIMREQNIYVLSASATGIHNISANSAGISIYPNPVQNNLLSGRVSLPFTAHAGLLEIISPDGRTLYRNIPVTDGGLFEIDITGLAAGVYLLHVQGAAGMVQKFIKQ